MTWISCRIHPYKSDCCPLTANSLFCWEAESNVKKRSLDSPRAQFSSLIIVFQFPEIRQTWRPLTPFVTRAMRVRGQAAAFTSWWMLEVLSSLPLISRVSPHRVCATISICVLHRTRIFTPNIATRRSAKRPLPFGCLLGEVIFMQT